MDKPELTANVYALVEQRGSSFDLYMVCGTQQEALDYYQSKTGRPGSIDERKVEDGIETLVLDADTDGGAAYIARYSVGIVEVLDEQSAD